MTYFDQLFVADYWKLTFLGNALSEYMLALGVFVVGLVILKILQVLVLSRLRTLSGRTETDIDDLFVELADSVKPPFYGFVAFYVALRFLSVTSLFQKAINILLLVFIVYQVVRMTGVVIDYVVRKKTKSDESAANAAKFLSTIAKVILWALGLLLILQNAGINVTSLVAGLGIGGIAIAFALQNILADLFSSFAIYFDKPFEVGDVIKIGEHRGEVEKIGIKTTRIRSPEGEEIIISNQELISARLQNFKRLKERRVSLKFGVLYETAGKKLELIPEMVKEVVGGVKGARLQRAHFTGFGDSSLDFTVTYFVESDNYDDYLDRQQEVNFALRRRFEKEKIEMAYPTRTVYLSKS